MSEPTLHQVTTTICSLCLDGEGGECHTPGCILWLNRAPDLPLRESILEFGGSIVAPCGGTRCWYSNDLGWIHSSKSYGTCAVRSAEDV